MKRAGLVVALIVCAGVLDAFAQLPNGQGVRGRGVRPVDRAADRPGDRPADRPLPATAAVLGQVVLAGSGTPVRGAEVRVRATDGRENRLVTTDQEGRFAVRDLTPGDWTVIASKAGFISQQFGQRFAFQAAQPVAIRQGQRVTANFSLTRAGAISGHVYDEFGDVVAGAKVSALRSKIVRGRRQFTAAGVPDQTDDTGAFRVYALPPGEYYIGANLRLAPAENLIIDAVGSMPTYFPGTVTMADAQRVSVGPGDEQSNVNFSFQPVRAVRVSGVLLTSTGAPAAATSVNLMSTTATNPGGFQIGSTGVSRTDGSFTISNVAPGSYIAQVFRVGEKGMMDTEQAAVPVTVGAEDLTGLTIALGRGATLSGTVVAENGSPVPAFPPFSVTTRSTMSFSEMRTGPAPNGDFRSFNLPGVFGTVSVTVEGLSDQWMVKSIDVNGSDVTDTPFNVTPGETLKARIVLTNRVSTVSGRVTSRAPFADATVVVFPEDPAKWAYLSRYVRAERIGAEGAFTIRKLPPDSRYLAIALDYVEDEEFWDPEFLERLRSRATSFSIVDGDSRTLTLPIASR